MASLNCLKNALYFSGAILFSKAQWLATTLDNGFSANPPSSDLMMAMVSLT